jgi:sterol desaturase/sphingolipid hydroxylase (fatty acid hydroxylase superfamily)
MLTETLALFWNRIDWLGASVLLLVVLDFVVGAGIVYLREDHASGKRSLRGFIAYCLPKAIVLHPSARLDYAMVIVQKIVNPFVLWPLILLAGLAGNAVTKSAEALLGPSPGMDLWGWGLLCTVVAVLIVADFSTFWLHRLQHRVWWLWEFHKVHHSAEVLALGITGRRHHPIDEIAMKVIAGTFFPGMAFGCFAYLAGADIAEVTILGVDLMMIAKILTFYKLRESHIPMRFPPAVERIIISPAQHHVHHSIDPKHYDRNFGSVFAFWDVLFGSWAPSAEKPLTGYGLSDGESSHYRSLWQLYTRPFLQIVRRMRSRRTLALARM